MAIWCGSPNFWQDNTAWPKIACVIHTESGHEAATDAEFENQATQLSANASVDLAGTWRQFVHWEDAAWANGIFDGGSPWWQLPGVVPGVNPNYQTVSVETEDNGQPDTQPVTPAQFNTVVTAFKDAMTNWSIKYLVPHHLIYSGHSCPAARWLDPSMGVNGTSYFDLLTQALNLVGLKTADDVNAYIAGLH